MQGVKAKHLDVWLIAGLRAWPSTELRHCYLWPPVGNYTTHVSGCEAGGGVRKADWDKQWCQEGTRPRKPGEVLRQLGCCASGNATWLRAVDLTDPDHAGGLAWLTELPPSLEQTDEKMWALLSARGWIDEDYRWRGPPILVGETGKGVAFPSCSETSPSPSPRNVRDSPYWCASSVLTRRTSRGAASTQSASGGGGASTSACTRAASSARRRRW